MAQQVEIAGTVYNDVPYIQCPDANNVLHSFHDTTIASNAASAGDIVQGKLAYVNGILIEGTLMPIEKHTTTTISDFLTVPTGVTVEGSCTTYGEMVELYLKVKSSSAQSAKWTCGTLKHDYIPIDYSYSAEWTTGATAEAGTDGKIRINSSATANTSYYMSFVFVKKY